MEGRVDQMIPPTVLPYEGFLPYPVAKVLQGSEVIKIFWGVTPRHANSRAKKWIQKMINASDKNSTDIF